ncbi:MAG: hypothetical protein WEA99_07960 [Brumimicrobium sp.]
MKKLALFSLFFILLLQGCSEDKNEENTPTAVATFEIEGMVCEMGCGASIRKGLFETGAISNVDVDYNEENTSNSIKVYYDNDLTTPEKMETIIESLNEKQFKAKFVKSQNLSNKEKEKFKKKSSNDRSASKGVNASTRSFSFPNLTELINSLIH